MVEWKMFKATHRYTKLPMYVCFECWLASMKMKLAIFFIVPVSILLTIFLDTWQMSQHFWQIFQPSLHSAEKFIKNVLSFILYRKIHLKISTSTQKKLPSKNSFLHANIQNRYINSYILLTAKMANNTVIYSPYLVQNSYCLHVYVDICICVYMNVCRYVCMYPCMYVYKGACIYV